MDVEPPSVPVTVVAVCFNHERFVLECLESIRAQTFQDFELIVADDCSRDRSPEIIAEWLEQHYPNARFIRHERNMGLCKTLNEILSVARGEFLSMIATDDLWETDKIERQVTAILAQPGDVAVVYSDAGVMDEAGAPMQPDFIERHRPGIVPPSGDVFSALVAGNFIPAMSTMTRRGAVESVGGYDERLSYEDYDMWLRLARSHKFSFLPGKVAKYRIVATSLVRTQFFGRSAAHFYTGFEIREKWLKSNALTTEQRTRWVSEQHESAYELYALGDSRAAWCLWLVAWRARSPKAMALAIASSLGISRQRLKGLASALRAQG